MNGSYHLVAADREAARVVKVEIFIGPKRIGELLEEWVVNRKNEIGGHYENLYSQ